MPCSPTTPLTRSRDLTARTRWHSAWAGSGPPGAPGSASPCPPRATCSDWADRRAFNAAALEAGEAAVAVGVPLGLVPVRVGAAVTWCVHPADRRQLPDVGEADRALRSALLETADALAALEVAKWRPEVADELMNLRHPTPAVAPAGVPGRCLDLAGRGLQAMTIVDLALADDGGAVTAWEIEQRREAAGPARACRPPRPGRGVLPRGLAPGVTRYAEAQTPSSLPLGSVKWKRRPPGNS